MSSAINRSGRRRAVGALVVLALGQTAHADEQLMEHSGCISCHRVDQKLIGPAFTDVAKRYRGDRQASTYLMQKIREGGDGVWGDVPMQPNGPEKVSDDDLKRVIEWILQL